MSETIRRHLPLIAAIAFVGVALFVYGLLIDSFELRLAAKPWPVLGLMALVYARTRTRYARLVLVGLALCLVGDMLLEFRQRFFLYGMIAFLLGHVGYIAAFVTRTRALRPLEAVPLLAWIVWALSVLVPTLGKMLVPVSAYTVVIFVMMWRATAVAASGPTSMRSAWMAMAGALTFAFSDTLIALDRFHQPMEGVRVPIILTYWVAQALIAGSALLHDADEESDTEDAPGRAQGA